MPTASRAKMRAVFDRSLRCVLVHAIRQRLPFFGGLAVATISQAALIRSAWTSVSTCLEDRKQQIYSEIRDYPTPIAGCDQQFNFLLEQLRDVSHELQQARSFVEVRHVEDNAIEVFKTFVAASEFLTDESKRRIETLLIDERRPSPGPAT